MTKRVLAVASSGGHWQQLMMMRPGYDAHRLHFLTTQPGLAEQFDARPHNVIPDCNRNQPFRALGTALLVGWHILRLRPDIVISTGALPGVIALATGKLLGARTIWVDSIANAEEMSASGRLARRFAHLWLCQWPDVAEREGADYSGSVL